MSSCFLCDCSYKFTENDKYSVFYAEGKSENHYMKYMPIVVGSSGTDVDDQQHKNNKKQNYVSYKIKKIEFRAYVEDGNSFSSDIYFPDYIIMFKVPFREVVFDYHFGVMQNFILYSEPESVLKYGVYSRPVMFGDNYSLYYQKRPDKYDLVVDKPFIVGPNDYVGVLYFFRYRVRVDASARVWFDVA